MPKHSFFNRLGPGRLWLTLEFIAFFVAIPAYFYVRPTRINIHIALWMVAVYTLIIVREARIVSWRALWHGVGWPMEQRKIAAIRFCISTAAVILFAWFVVPDRLFSFPMQRPGFWLLVMTLYPVLSVLPQELVFRSFFFKRYQSLFPDKWALIIASAVMFAFIHIVFHNWVSPLFCLMGGLFFAHSYSHHRSLKWAVIEHAAYGCMVFTVGIGFYFLVGGYRP